MAVGVGIDLAHDEISRLESESGCRKLVISWTAIRSNFDQATRRWRSELDKPLIKKDSIRMPDENGLNTGPLVPWCFSMRY